jgi:hypothetical protein
MAFGVVPSRVGAVANPRTFSTAESAELIGAPSERGLIERLRSGFFRARKIGRHWRMTDQDIADALDACANDSRITGTGPHGLTPIWSRPHCLSSQQPS